MELKDEDTNESLGDDNAASQLIKAYARQNSEEQVLSLAFEGFNAQEESSVVDLMSYREQLTEAVDKISKAKQHAFEAHNAADKLKECALHHGQAIVKQAEKQSPQASLQMHFGLITGLQQQIEAVLGKIRAYKCIRARIERMRRVAIRINALMLKKYNMQNYIQQMQLVREMLKRIAGKLSSNSFDFRFLEEIMGKELIPYTFYYNYCLNVSCIVVSKKLQQQSLVVIKQSSTMPQLFAHMRTYFFYKKDLYQNCSQFLRLMQVVRVITAQNMSIEDGFAHLFKPYFLQVLEEVEEIECTNFMKARSLMQASPFTVELWREYEEYQIERYVLWNFEQFNYLRKSQLLHLAKIKEITDHFKQNYEWINSIALKSNKIHGSNDFTNDFLKAAVMKILAPFLNQLYEAALSNDRKTVEKHKQQFHTYWTYCIFGKYQLLYRFISHNLAKYFSCKQVSEEGELNNDQYFKYYQQMGELLDKDTGSQFKALWSDCWIKLCSLGQPIDKTRQDNPEYLDEIEHIYHIKELQARLQQLLKNKKMKKEERMDCIYGKVVNLNLNSSKYFLLREAIKLLDKSVEKELNSIRDIAYTQLA